MIPTKSAARPHRGSLEVGGQRASLCDVLDRVLDKGAVVAGEVTLSLAGVDLVYVNLRLLLASSARLIQINEEAGAPARPQPETVWPR
ncbi:MAG: gas vesicle protein [Acidobacteria bacterium]|nr:gas vesicle protein [Acidobacteriota bacterium]